MSDDNLTQLAALAHNYHTKRTAAEQAREPLDALIQAMKANGYSYPVIARTTQLSIATIQNVVAKGERQR